jgi:hypothetical protein
MNFNGSAIGIQQKSMYQNVVFGRTAVFIERSGTPNAEKPGQDSATVVRATGIA